MAERKKDAFDLSTAPPELPGKDVNTVFWNRLRGVLVVSIDAGLRCPSFWELWSVGRPVDEWPEASCRENGRTLKLRSRFRSEVGWRGCAAGKVVCARHLGSRCAAHKQYLGVFLLKTAKVWICLVKKKKKTCLWKCKHAHATQAQVHWNFNLQQAASNSRTSAIEGSLVVSLY